MENLEKNKKKRAVVRTAVTKLINQIETILKEENVDYDLIEELLDQLSVKTDSLKELDKHIGAGLKLEEYETEVISAEEYQDKISLTAFRARKKLKDKTLINVNDNYQENITRHERTNENKFVKLPKLSIQKFFGDSSQYMSFWNSFKVSIHDNESLSKIEKFNYLKSYLGGNAASAISGFAISEKNYDSALQILENRFGRKDTIINSHMYSLLNLTPVHKSSDIFKLKKLHDNIETNVRSLSALGIETTSYSNMLIPVILKNLPNDLTLEYNRRHIEDFSQSDVDALLKFLQTEIQSRERTCSISFPQKPFEHSRGSRSEREGSARPRRKSETTLEFIAAVSESKTNKNCVFCKREHISESCDSHTVEKKRDILKAEGRCFLCLGLKHRIKECRSRLLCRNCNGKHNLAICFKSCKSDTIQLEGKKEQGDSKVISAVSHNKGNQILLQTCCAKVKTKQNELYTRILLDSGSMRTFITQEMSNKLKLDIIKREKLSVFTFGSNSPIEKTYDVVKLTLEHRHFPDSKVEIEALVTDQISGSNIPSPESKVVVKNKMLRNLTLADPPDSQGPIVILIGADYYYSIVTGNIKHVDKSLVAVETIFGWCLQGRKSDDHVSLALSVIVQEDLISEQMKKFWDLESLGINEEPKPDSFKNEVMKYFESNIKYENYRYNVRLPWKFDVHQLNDNREIAERRFYRLSKRFQRNPELFFKYREVIEDYLKQGIIELVPNNTNDGDSVTYYLPYREVIREDRITSKLRIVFDASSHAPNSLSLNDCLHVGPNLYPDLFDILLRFRFNSVAYTTDMRQAFLQIMIDEQDRNVSRFLFTEDPNNESLSPLVYRFTRVLFGINSSPFLLAATIKHHLEKYFDKYPKTVNFLNENVYVDDIIGSHRTTEQAFTTTLESIHIFKEASMPLHKWRTNSKALHELWKTEGIVPDDSFEIFGEENLPYKVLGMAWDNSEDVLYFDIRSLLSFLSRRIDTKRFLLQAISRVFDPIGFLGPFTVRIKYLMQKIWSLGIDWDETLPEDICSPWRSWCEEVPKLTEFSVPRYYFFETPDSEFENLELHCFSDASTKAYGTVIYLRMTTHSQQIQTVFVASKNRVAPLKTLTLPRLELMGALLSARLSNNVLNALKVKIPCYFWTDSKITYFWIRGSPGKFKPFVKNRIEEIHKLTSSSDWHHCPGTDNPADLVSRGTKISRVINDPIWLRGPNWLKLSPEFWPKLDNEEAVDEANKDELEYRKRYNDTLQCECIVEDLENPMDISTYSNLEKLLRVTAWLRRFIKKLKKMTDIQGTLITEELHEAENYWIRNEQKKFFAEEFKSLKENNSVNKNSTLYSFVPFLDENEIMRIGGRLELSSFSADEKHPIILPKGSWLTVLVTRQEHENTMHGGTAATLAKIRSRFWIPKGRQLTKSIIKKCVICQKYLARPANQATAPLPTDRVNETPPFSVCGIDFAGPLYVKSFKETRKSYIVLFTCAVTRALHLELVSDMSTDSFLLAFRRFLSRRGNCKIIYSDNAKTFVKGKKEIENFSNILSNNTFLNFVAKERIIWKNIIERAAWWGGFYERLVKSVKECLRKIIGKALLTYEEMSTLLVEVESVLNLRPLTYVYSENDEPQPLTPMHFLNFGQVEPTYPVSFAEIIDSGSKRLSLLKRKRYQSLLLKQLWSKWKQQYLLQLRTAHSMKNPESRDDLKVGDVVLIEDNTKNKLLWKLGKIERAIPGRDNKTRCYELKTSNGLLKRTVQHLYPLEL